MDSPPVKSGYLWAATGLTFVGLGLGVAAVGLAVTGRLPEAFVLLIGSGLADLFDGWVARRTGAGGSPLGAELDSLVDVASFGLVPVVLVLAARDAPPGGGVGLLELAVGWVYLSCAVLRLARFNARPDPGPVTRYQGVPVTYAALVFPLVFVAEASVPGVGSGGLLLPAAAALAVLFVVPLPVPKPRGVAYPLFLLLAVAVAAYLLLVVAPGSSP